MKNGVIFVDLKILYSLKIICSFSLKTLNLSLFIEFVQYYKVVEVCRNDYTSLVCEQLFFQL